jgi:hypothetical protein
MAKVMGGSRAWRYLVQPLWRLGLRLDNLSQLRAELDRLERGLQKTDGRLGAELELELERTERRLLEVDQYFLEQITAQERLAALAVVPWEARLAQLRSEGGFFRRLRNWFVALSVLAEVEQTKGRFQAEIGRLQSIAAEQKEDLICALDNRRKVIERTVARVRAALASQALADAEAELQVIDELARLPDEYEVFHDVNVEVESGRGFDRPSHEGCRINHVVLAPFGVFVVSTVYRLRTSDPSSYRSDPYTQLANAKRICAKYWGRKRGPISFRGIIATVGEIPVDDRHRDDASMHLGDLVGYIREFESRDPALRPECRLEIGERLARCTGRE